MAKITINENCIGCGACVCIAPDVFDFNNDGLAIVKEECDLEINNEAIEQAIPACPVEAIEKQ